MMINMRVHEVDPWGGQSESLPPGEYVFVIESADLETSPGKGTQQLALGLRVAGGPLDGRKLKHWFNLDHTKTGSRKRLRSLIDATGLPMDANGAFDSDQLINRPFVADVIQEPYNKTDPASGRSEEKMATRVVNERPYSNGTAVAGPAVPQTGAAPQGGNVVGFPQAAPQAAPQAVGFPTGGAPAPQQTVTFPQPTGAPVPAPQVRGAPSRPS